MGLCLCSHIMDDDGQLSRNQHLQRDLTVVKNRIQAKKLPIVWMNNDGDSKKIGTESTSHSHACNIAERFGYACISLDKVLKDESVKETNRGKMIKQRLSQKRKLSDRLILNLLKERIIEAGDTRGYLINGFPRTAKQSTLFVKEIANVDCIILLESAEELTNALNNSTNIGSEDRVSQPADKSIQKTGKTVTRNVDDVANDNDIEKIEVDKPSGDRQSQDVMNFEELYKNLYANGTLKYDLLIEKINTNEPQADVFLKIEAAILDRLSISNM